MFFGDHLKYCWVIDERLIEISDFWILTSWLVGLMLCHCLWRWQNIKTTLRRRFVLEAIITASSMLKCRIGKVLLFISSTQCWFNAEQLSATLAPHWNIIGYRPLCFNLLNVESAQRVGRVASDKGPLFDNQDAFMDFSRHVNHWTEVSSHSDPKNP